MNRQIGQPKLTKVNTLFIDFKALAKQIDGKDTIELDYRRIGVTYKKRNINLSQVMYNNVKTKNGGTKGTIIMVDETTFNQTKSSLLESIVMSLYPKVEKGLSAELVQAYTRYQIYFIKWFWKNEMNFPKNIQDAKNVFLLYKKYLQSLVSSENIGLISAHCTHDAARIILEYIFNDMSGEIASVGVIKQKKKSNNAFDSVKKTRNEIEYSFMFYYTLFDQLADFLLEGKPYPYKIQLPRGNAILVPRVLENVVPSYQDVSKNTFQCIDFQNGHIKSVKELRQEYENLKGKERAVIRSSLMGSRKALIERLLTVNQDMKHAMRLEIGNKAMKAYFMALLAITGANDSILGRQKWWSDDFTTTKETHEFLEIKPRAKNKKVYFEIRKHFISSFRKFIQVRRLVLNGRECEYLFFNLHRNKIIVTDAQLEGRYARSMWNQTFLPIDDELPNVFSRDFRKDKALEFLRKGPKYAVAGLQNSYDTLLNNYNGMSGEEMAQEMESVFISIHECTVTADRSDTEIDGLVGGCIGHDSKPYTEKIEVEPDCNDPKTCIFCTSFRAHPIKEDIRKLYSLEFIIREIALSRAESQEEFERAMKPWLERIELLLKEMLEIDPECKLIMNFVRDEVFDEQLLSPYWSTMLEHYEILGVLR